MRKQTFKHTSSIRATHLKKCLCIRTTPDSIPNLGQTNLNFLQAQMAGKKLQIHKFHKIHSAKCVLLSLLI